MKVSLVFLISLFSTVSLSGAEFYLTLNGPDPCIPFAIQSTTPTTNYASTLQVYYAGSLPPSMSTFCHVDMFDVLTTQQTDESIGKNGFLQVIGRDFGDIRNTYIGIEDLLPFQKCNSECAYLVPYVIGTPIRFHVTADAWKLLSGNSFASLSTFRFNAYYYNGPGPTEQRVDVNLFDIGGRDTVINVADLPEPSTFALAAGAFGLLAWRRKACPNP
jgi:hypothetical protein